ncbi:MarR family winged helix-turn-helix transcriptional regulator [Marinobacter sp. M1N3S26]|uniref:MarR family winged helix-turn-helix transcriptional regulator n=1 Tax=unclassified Marinobacter TaxID=83889 RepID=UPI00387B01B2
MPSSTPARKSATTKDAFSELQGALAERPGFLIRRLHQIHVALFHDECGRFNITPVQYSVLTALRDDELDQKHLGHSVGIDRATTTEVLRRLEKTGWLERRKCTEDNRRQLASLTEAGRRLLDEVDASAQAAHDRTVEPLTRAERARFIRYMIKIVSASNDHGRASLKLP